MMFYRDVTNMTEYFGAFAPELLTTDYGKEIWAIYERGKLTPETPLTGKFKGNEKIANVGNVLSAIQDARIEHEKLLLKKQMPR
jgi:RIO kinase 1